MPQKIVRKKKDLVQDTFDKYPGLNKFSTPNDYSIEQASPAMQKIFDKNKYQLEFIGKGDDKYNEPGFAPITLPNSNKNRTYLGKGLKFAKKAAQMDLVSHGFHQSPDYNEFTNDFEQKLIGKYGKEDLQKNGGVDAYIRGYLSDLDEYKPYKEELKFLPKDYFDPLHKILNGTQHVTAAPIDSNVSGNPTTGYQGNKVPQLGDGGPVKKKPLKKNTEQPLTHRPFQLPDGTILTNELVMKRSSYVAPKKPFQIKEEGPVKDMIGLDQAKIGSKNNIQQFNDDDSLKGMDKEAREWTKEYISSPKYRERLAKFYSNPDEIQKKRLAAIDKIKVTHRDLEWYDPKAQAVYDPIENNITVFESPNREDAKELRINNQGEALSKFDATLAHEFSHANNAGIFPGRSLNSKEEDFISSRNKSVQERKASGNFSLFAPHKEKPEENKSDIDAFRYLLKKQGVYDAGKEDFNQKILNKARSLQINNSVPELFDNFSDDAIIDLMNNVASNNIQQVPVAKKGIIIKKLADGGDPPVNALDQEVADWTKSYVASPKYKQRLGNFYKYPEVVQRKRQEVVDNIKFNPTTEGTQALSYYRNANDITVGPLGVKTEQMNNPKANPNLVRQQIVAHEFSHATNANIGTSGSYLSPTEQKYILDRNKSISPERRENVYKQMNTKTSYGADQFSGDILNDFEHDNAPSESKSDIDATRFLLNKAKIYDAGTQDFNAETLKKARANKSLQTSPVFKRLQQNFDDKGLIEILNKVAVNDTVNPNNNTTMAKYGTQIKRKVKKMALGGINDFDPNDPLFAQKIQEFLKNNPDAGMNDIFQPVTSAPNPSGEQPLDIKMNKTSKQAWSNDPETDDEESPDDNTNAQDKDKNKFKMKVNIPSINIGDAVAGLAQGADALATKYIDQPRKIAAQMKRFRRGLTSVVSPNSQGGYDMPVLAKSGIQINSAYKNNADPVDYKYSTTSGQPWGNRADNYKTDNPAIANVQVEGGEFLELPEGQTSNINGDKHSDYSGGELMSLPEGARVYSDSLKVDKDFAKDLTGSKFKKKKTVADVAKKYKTDHEEGILKDTMADNISKRSANIMKTFKQHQLQQLFDYQESIKDPMYMLNKDTTATDITNSPELMEDGGPAKKKIIKRTENNPWYTNNFGIPQGGEKAPNPINLAGQMGMLERPTSTPKYTTPSSTPESPTSTPDPLKPWTPIDLTTIQGVTPPQLQTDVPPVTIPPGEPIDPNKYDKPIPDNNKANPPAPAPKVPWSNTLGSLGEIAPEMLATIQNQTDFPIFNAKFQPKYLNPVEMNIQASLNKNYAQTQPLLEGTGNPATDNARKAQAIANLYDANNQMFEQKFNFDTQNRYQTDSQNIQTENAANRYNLERTDAFWDKVTQRQAVKEATTNNIANSAYAKFKRKQLEQRSLQLTNQMFENYKYDPNSGMYFDNNGNKFVFHEPTGNFINVGAQTGDGVETTQTTRTTPKGTTSTIRRKEKKGS